MKLKLQYFSHPDVKSRLIRIDPDAREDWRQEEKGMTEDEMVGWGHWLNGHEFEQTPGDGQGMGSLYIHGWFMSMYGKNHYNTVK